MSILREELVRKNLTGPSSIKQAGTSFHQTVLMDQPWVNKDLVVLCLHILSLKQSIPVASTNFFTCIFLYPNVFILRLYSLIRIKTLKLKNTNYT